MPMSWDRPRLEEAVALWARGLSMGQMAQHFGCGRSPIASLIFRHRGLFPPRAPGRHRKRPVTDTMPRAKPKPRPVPPPPASSVVPRFTINHPHVAPASKQALRAQLEQALANTAKLKVPKWAVIK